MPEQLSRLACTCWIAGRVWGKPKTPCGRRPSARRALVSLASPGPRYSPTAQAGVADARSLERRRPEQALSNLRGSSAGPSRASVPPQKVHCLPEPAARQHTEVAPRRSRPGLPALTLSPLRLPFPPRPEPVAAPDGPLPGVGGPEGLGEQRSWPQRSEPSCNGRPKKTGRHPAVPSAAEWDLPPHGPREKPVPGFGR